MFRKVKVDVIFYYPHHFNRGKNGENQFFVNLINTCQTNQISYIVFEEIDNRSQVKRNTKNIPFDFLFFLIISLRRCLFWQKNVIKKDQMIGRFLNKLLFDRLKFKNVISLSQSMVSFFRGFNPNCNIYDLQHGIIHNNKPNYILHNQAEDNLFMNNVHLLLNGQSFKDILVKHEASSYFKLNSTVIGSAIHRVNPIHKRFNNKILITLQFTDDHDTETNQILYRQLINFINSNKSVNFYLKHHPRFKDEIDLSALFLLSNVHLAPKNINECFQKCSLHATAYSTSVFEAALYGIPSILINSLTQFNYFAEDFKYPIHYAVDDFKEEVLYKESSERVILWVRNFYTQYDEKKFLELIK